MYHFDFINKSLLNNKNNVANDDLNKDVLKALCDQIAFIFTVLSAE